MDQQAAFTIGVLIIGVTVTVIGYSIKERLYYTNRRLDAIASEICSLTRVIEEALKSRKETK